MEIISTTDAHEAILANLEPELIILFEEFLNRIQGKSMAEIMPILAEFKSKMPKNREFSDEERRVILESALQTLPEEQQSKFNAMLKMWKVV
jgi:hypothetical protein